MTREFSPEQQPELKELIFRLKFSAAGLGFDWKGIKYGKSKKHFNKNHCSRGLDCCCSSGNPWNLLTEKEGKN